MPHGRRHASFRRDSVARPQTWSRPRSGQKSLRLRAIVSETIGNGWETVADTPAKKTDAQAAMKAHLSLPTGAFDGKHGISLAIASDADVRRGAISSAIAF